MVDWEFAFSSELDNLGVANDHSSDRGLICFYEIFILVTVSL